MAEKDITEKLLEDYNDVFADIVNVLLFDGRRIIGEDALTNAKDKSQYKIANVIHEQERDVAKFWSKGKVRIALCGLENQTTVDKDMPLRIISYDGAAYRAQIAEEEKAKSSFPRYPVVTLVLYFGMTRWSGSSSLLECLEIPEEMKPYVSDYKINIFEIAFLEDEQIEKFQSDFRIVANYFVQKRKNKDYKPSREIIRHVDEVLKLMSVLTQDERFAEVQNESRGEVKNMCEILDKVEGRGIAKGFAQGLEQGLEQGLIRGEVLAFTEVGLSATEIARRVNITEEEVNKIIQEQEDKVVFV